MSDKSLKFELGRDGYTNDICRWAALNQIHTISIDNFERDFDEMEEALYGQFRSQSSEVKFVDGKLNKDDFNKSIRVRPLIRSVINPAFPVIHTGSFPGDPRERIGIAPSFTLHKIKFAILKD